MRARMRLSPRTFCALRLSALSSLRGHREPRFGKLMSAHLITRATILGTGLIGGSFALALRKYATDLHISGWDRPEVLDQAQARNIFDAVFTDLPTALHTAELIYIALPI